MLLYKIGIWAFVILTLFNYGWTIFSLIYIIANDIKF